MSRPRISIVEETCVRSRKFLDPGYLPDGATLHWSEVTASSLIGLDKEGNVVEEGCYGGGPEMSAACIHLGIRRVLPKLKVTITKPQRSDLSLWKKKSPLLRP